MIINGPLVTMLVCVKQICIQAQISISPECSLVIYISCVEMTRCNALACDWSAVRLVCVSLVGLPL